MPLHSAWKPISHTLLCSHYLRLLRYITLLYINEDKEKAIKLLPEWYSFLYSFRYIFWPKFLHDIYIFCSEWTVFKTWTLTFVVTFLLICTCIRLSQCEGIYEISSWRHTETIFISICIITQSFVWNKWPNHTMFVACMK